MKQTEHRDMTGLDLFILFFPCIPGFLWAILSEEMVMAIVFIPEQRVLYNTILLLSFPLCFPLYCMLLYKRQLANTSFGPAVTYFGMDMYPTGLISSFLTEQVQRLISWEGEGAFWILVPIGAGILLAAMWLVAECIFRWMSKRKNPL